jgi:SAM-dependent methyltransferase
MPASGKNRRGRYLSTRGNPKAMLREAHELAASGRFDNAFDIYEQLLSIAGVDSVAVLADLYSIYASMRNKHGDRYTLYQSRLFDFGITPTEKVLDIGSGHLPFPLATHLSDVTIENHTYGRAGRPFKHIAGKPVHEFDIESIPFADREFDFTYCSHVLEHTQDPAKACEEIMRVSRRGYIETPTAAKDLWLCTANVSHHTMSVDLVDDDLLEFRRYQPEEMSGIGTDILLHMVVAPQTKREKAFAAALYLFPDRINTMLYWERKFRYKIRSCRDERE